MTRNWLASPIREYVISGLVIISLGLSYLVSWGSELLWLAVIVGSLPVFFTGLRALWQRKVTIDLFNAFALAVSFLAQEIRSAGFIVLMLSFASLLEWQTATRSRSAVEALLKLRPNVARRKRQDKIEEIPVTELQVHDEALVESGARVPVDGVLLSAKAVINEASLTGESLPVDKTVGDHILGGSLNEGEPFSLRVTRVGEDSTLEQMANLIREAAKNKSHLEKLADRFARLFLPIVIGLAGLIYLISRDMDKVAAVFLVACADDMAVAIPLAIQAALGHAADRGVIFKGGEFIDVLTRLKTIVLDKTGTLTYGNFAFEKVEINPDVDSETFWRLVGAAEKYSEHPIGRAIFKYALAQVGEVPDPDETKVYKGSGIWARLGSDQVSLGDASIFSEAGIEVRDTEKARFLDFADQSSGTAVAVIINQQVAGFVAIADEVRQEAPASIAALRKVGIQDIQMFTGDKQKIANRVASGLGITKIRSSMLPQDKVAAIGELARQAPVAMIGDGINDAAALVRADVSIAMGTGGSAIAVEAADMVILHDNLERVPEMVMFSRQVNSVIRWDIIIWFISNLIGLALVFTGIFGPALAAFYNFATDFLPLLNSARLLRKGVE